MNDVAKGLGEKNHKAHQRLLKKVETGKKKSYKGSEMSCRGKNIVNTNVSGKNTVKNHINQLGTIGQFKMKHEYIGEM